jgi:hypothetical protein
MFPHAGRSNVCDIPAAHKPERMFGRKFLLPSRKSTHTMGREFIIELHLFESSLVGA